MMAITSGNTLTNKGVEQASYDLNYDAYRKAWLETGMLLTSNYIGVIDPYPSTDSEKRNEWGYPPYDGDKDKGLNLPCTNKKLLLL